MIDTERIRILIVDDNSENLLSLEEILSQLNVEVILSNSGTQALELMVEYNFGLVILAEKILDMSGYEAAEFMRSHQSTAHIPIMIITEKHTGHHIFKGYNIGAVDYIASPIDIDVLKNKVNIFLNIHKHKLALEKKNKALIKANKIIIDQQKSVIEEERLKLLLQLSGTAAHEFSEPLTELIVNVELLKDHVDGDENISEFIGRIKKSTRQISNIVQKIQKIRQDEPVADGPEGTAGAPDPNAGIDVLIIDEQDEHYNKFARLLLNKERIKLSRAVDIREALEIMENQQFDIAIADYILPDGNCFGLMTNLKNAGHNLPVAVVTGSGDELVATQIIKAGAYDYLPRKKLTRSSLQRMIENILEKSTLRNEIKRANEKMAQMATVDKLTGLYNRRFFNDAVEAELERARRYGNEMLLLFVDLDFFKKVNDTYGHAAGDMVLRKVSRLFQEIKRKNDIICRYGGEEFAIILPNIDQNNGFEVAQKYRRAIENDTFTFNRYRFAVTTSIGLASSGEAESVEELLDNADKALYKAKKTGRNKVVVFEK